jgi:hypothetical protein
MRNTTPSFIAVFPLQASPQAQQALTIRLEAARHVYNACLGKAYAASIWRTNLKTGNAPAA